MEWRPDLLLALAVLIVGCSGTTEGDLEAAEDRWAASEVSSYDLEVRLTCFCPPDVAGPFDITVSNHEIAEVWYEGAVIEPTDATPTMAFTVEGLFGIVRENLSADALSVTYDDELGYPTLIDIDQDSNEVDDEWRVSADLTTP